MPPRKRSSAFDDFSGQPVPPAQPGSLSTAAASPEAVPPTARSAAPPQVERIERLKPSQMLPDRYQPRRLLPTSLRQPFFSGKITCYQAAAEWLALSHSDAGLKAEVDRLLAMGDSFDEHGQIKPITGSWISLADGRYLFLIETGERRFWAACLRVVRDHLSEEPLLRVEVVDHPTRQRQVLENRHAEMPSAVGQACEVAALILAELGVPPIDGTMDEIEYFRQARAQRMPAGLWERIIPVMQLTRPRMVQLLNILQLPTSLLDLADRYRLPERVLREILALPKDNWDRLIQVAIRDQLTAEEVAGLEFASLPPQTSGAPVARTHIPFYPGRVATSGLRRFANALAELDEISQAQALDEVADLLVGSGQAEGMIFLLGELARLVQIRLDARRR